MCTLAIIGGSQESSIKKYAKKQDIEILFHNGKMSQRTSKYRSLINRADVVTVMVDALNHNSMNTARSLAKELNKPIVYTKGRGISMAIYMALNEYHKIKNK
ncbi:DUF2325 domain-containing protein [Robertmurraya massiliosenegalensis]|uniref:DUF2325 domain-containing protein n=1 Tax=Robertmurraya massiliosenegalensis TaxID=1287657 RepID=UPI0002F1CFD2|nr:DUF2325 domain-containing protein [Robertmurraya massiliosenegalensis]